MAPHEWLRTAEGKILKVDGVGHDADHTMVGRQALTWDVAGAWIEWNLDDASGRPLLAAMRQCGGWAPSESELVFYQLAYAAFRMGQCSLCAEMAGDDGAEGVRLGQARAFYRGQLERMIQRLAGK